MPERLRVIRGEKSKKPKPVERPKELAAEWVNPKRLKPWPGNPRKNDPVVDHIVESIKQFGFGAPIVARRTSFEIIAGHTRWKAAMKIGLAWVPVRFMDLTEEQSHLLCVADNRLGEFADWDLPKLHKFLATTKIEEVAKAGWSDEDMRKLEKSARDAQEDDDEGSLPPPPADPITRPGDLWRLGNHRLVCGDACDPRHVALARGKLSPFIMVTDPQGGDPGADTVPDWRAAYRLFSGDVAYIWHGAQYAVLVESGLTESAMKIRSQIVWVKQIATFGQSTYHWQHELCWYAVRERSGVNPRWCGDRTQTTVWEIANSNPMGGGKSDDVKTNHPHQKPLECMMRPMRNHGRTGDVVYDPFAGSGTSIVAAEKLERVCVALDINPAYCDVIVDRWQRLTGGKAKRSAV